MCQNGGSCRNISPPSGFFGFRCDCPAGFSGEYCEICNKFILIFLIDKLFKISYHVDDQCSVNPCAVGRCIKIGTNGFLCPDCPSCVQGFLSNNQIITTTPTSTSTTTRTTTTTIPITTTTSSTSTTTRTTTTTIPITTTTTIPITTTTSSTSTTTRTTTTTIPITTTTTIPLTTTPTSASTTTRTATTLFRPETTTPLRQTTSTQVPTTSTVINSDISCIDGDNFICQYYSGRNLCIPNAFIRGESILTYCRKSCNQCSIVPSQATTTVSSTFSRITTRSTTRASSTISDILCVDGDNFICPYFAGINLCIPNAFIRGESVLTYCKKSCNQCSTISTTQRPCLDSQAACVFWSNNCRLIANLNPHPCQKTCRIC